MAIESLGGNLSQRLDDKLDRFFDNEALPNSTTKTSEVRRFASVGSKVELVVVADDAVTNSASIVINVLGSDTSTGTFTIYETKTVSAGTYAAETELFRYTPNTDAPHYAKVSVVTTENLSTKKFTATSNYTS